MSTSDAIDDVLESGSFSGLECFRCSKLRGKLHFLSRLGSRRRFNGLCGASVFDLALFKGIYSGSSPTSAA